MLTKYRLYLLNGRDLLVKLLTEIRDVEDKILILDCDKSLVSMHGAIIMYKKQSSYCSPSCYPIEEKDKVNNAWSGDDLLLCH